jgi:hypothetical protein
MIKQFKYLLVVAGVLTAASQASAENVSYPGGSCKAADGTLGVGSVRGSGDFTNRSATYTLDAICPVVTSSNAPSAVSAKVVFVDQSTSAQDNCFVTSGWYDSSGTFYWYQSATMATGVAFASTAPVEKTVSVSFGALGQNMQLQCGIAPTTSIGPSSIFRYEIQR